jgi:hypothetical protein
MPGLVLGIHGTPTEWQPLLNSRVFPQPVSGRLLTTPEEKLEWLGSAPRSAGPLRAP